ncbi:MAG: condensation domain-containing protein, partial [Candidatus Binatia bacterium]
MAKIWSQVLRVEQVGIHDNFFDLGGDSILATQIISRVRDLLRVELSFLVFFETPTVAGMAAGVETAGGESRDARISPISAVPRDGELPLSFAQQRLWFFDQLAPSSPAYNRSSFLRLTGRLDTAALERSLNEIVRRHEVLRTTFPSVDGRPYQLISPALTVALPIVDLRKSVKTEREAEARRLAVAEGRRPFDLTSDPPLRAALLRLDEEDRILVLTTHHIAFDGWSDGILFEELAALYKAFSTGRPSPLSDLPIQYADYAAWQRQRLDREALDTQLAYWKPQLSGAPPVLELPTDRPRPPVATFRGARQSILLPEAMS